MVLGVERASGDARTWAGAHWSWTDAGGRESRVGRVGRVHTRRRVRDAVGRRPEGRHLAFACSLESALARAGAQPPLRSTRVKLPASPTAARTARRVLARACEEWEVPGCRGTGELVVSELVTNALQHARSHLTLVVASDAARMVRVGVHDPLRVAPSTRAPSEDGLGGRGLHIVETVAEAAGALPASDGGKVVWATVAVDGGLS